MRRLPYLSSRMTFCKPDPADTDVALVRPDDAAVETDSRRLRPEYEDSVRVRPTRARSESNCSDEEGYSTPVSDRGMW